MEPISAFLLTAAGYILKGAANSKTAEGAKDEILGRFWKWIKPFFIKTVPEIEEKADHPETEAKTQEQLLTLIKDEAFFKELAKQVAALQQAGIKEKNIVRKDIENVKEIRIGDKGFSPNDHYDRKNIVEGNIKGADSLTIGDDYSS
jgi:hypothetical protein